jgi:hypothetical protein
MNDYTVMRMIRYDYKILTTFAWYWKDHQNSDAGNLFLLWVVNIKYHSVLISTVTEKP